MKKYLNNKDGMALPMVLIIMAILTTLSLGLAALAHNSYVSVRWMSEEKQAYYLARAGVEAASYAYQEAVSKASSGSVADGESLDSIKNFVKIGEYIAQDGENAEDYIITSERVYAYYTDSTNANNGTVWDGFEFSLEASSTSKPGYFGYFDVRVGNGVDLIKVQSSSANAVNGYEEVDQPVKVFESVGTVPYYGDDNELKEYKQTVYAYITPAETVGGTTLYDENGVLKRATGEGAFTKKDSITFNYETLDTNITVGENASTWKKLTTWVKNIFNGFLNQVYHQLATVKNSNGEYLFPNMPRNRTIDMYSKISDATLVLTKPANSKVIKGGPKNDSSSSVVDSTTGEKLDTTQNYGDNFYVISSGENLFLQDVGIDATPEKGQYNSIGLFGDQIIIDGNITLYAYITNPDSLWGDALSSTVALLGNRFRLGTVLLGHGRVYDKNDEKLKAGTSITDAEGNPVLANKVYFNGNVVLKLYVQGSGTETYRIFNAGDMAYFYGSYSESATITTSTGDKDSTASGIDLLKYFVDAVIAGRDGYDIYGDAVVEKMKSVKKIYYGEDSPSYFEGDAVLFERLIVTTDNYGHVKVNGETGRIDEIIQPTPSSSSTITWGQPRKSDVFHPTTNE